MSPNYSNLSVYLFLIICMIIGLVVWASSRVRKDKIKIWMIFVFVLILVPALLFFFRESVRYPRAEQKHVSGINTYPATNSNQQQVSSRAYHLESGAPLVQPVNPQAYYLESGEQLVETVNQTPPTPLPAEAVGPMWQVAAEEAFKTDTYLSRDAALKALARLTIEAGIPLTEKMGQPEEIQLWRLVPQSGSLISTEVPQVFVETMKQKWPEVEITFGATSDIGSRLQKQQAKDTLFVFLTIPYIMPLSDQALLRNSRAGELQAEIYGRRGKETRSVKFAEKSWVLDFGTFAGLNKELRLHVARSTEVCLTENEAQRQCESQAVSLVGDLLRREKGLILFGQPLTAADLWTHKVIIDNFYQQLESSGGPVWRGALLLDISPAKMDNLVQRKTAVQQSVHEGRLWGWAKRLGSFFGVLALISVIYFFLNAATRGYYTLALRIAMVVLVLALLLIIGFV